jgi:hypothetical protein
LVLMNLCALFVSLAQIQRVTVCPAICRFCLAYHGYDAHLTVRSRRCRLAAALSSTSSGTLCLPFLACPSPWPGLQMPLLSATHVVAPGWQQRRELESRWCSDFRCPALSFPFFFKHQRFCRWAKCASGWLPGSITASLWPGHSDRDRALPTGVCLPSNTRGSMHFRLRIWRQERARRLSNLLPLTSTACSAMRSILPRGWRG